MLQDEKSKKFDTKKLELTVKEDDKKPRDVGKLTVELGDYASAGKHGPFTLALDGDKKASKKSSKDSSRGSPSVKFDVESEWTHFNKKKITDKKKEGKEGVEIDGVEYGLETDNSDMSEDDATTLGDMSESESEIESEEEEDSDADEGMKEMSAPVKRNDDLKRLEAEAADLRSQLKQKAEDNERLTQLLSAEQQKSSAGASGVASSGATAELEEELESTQKKLKKAKKEIEEKEKRIDELQLLVVKAGSSTSGASAGESVEALKKQVDKQKTDIKALNKENRDSKDKIETLQQELDRAKSGGGGGGAGSDAKELENLRKKLKSFEKEKEEDELIEREIYCMTTKYRSITAATVRLWRHRWRFPVPGRRPCTRLWAPASRGRSAIAVQAGPAVRERPPRRSVATHHATRRNSFTASGGPGRRMSGERSSRVALLRVQRWRPHFPIMIHVLCKVTVLPPNLSFLLTQGCPTFKKARLFL
ncbi:uncharacterized protein ACA1_134400 [Acanthamoeba castellanii str. Neff]|uniref:C2 NT-type domain-containing protein n=1 Tax=Acanthamoeba castellanii (strain ATCC 30010 / Neff) TaxID=1257118 RepID=L8GF46_ACACF|nr:uncharacterized protein ACA1_134400 [Acanthamoeba castellanii str. Neff]ELR11363.1 hypothetical protein ACA1_134400 [Acanthamoeba castellanii str. Neff]